ncbi:TPA: pantoate--beta-alanine ligase [bacterium]|nr:pantoate--beta-alanine ligase [bacterium]
MEIITQVKEMQKRVEVYRNAGKSVGFVPTMGALHEGHFSLMRQARKDNDLVIISIFVNPLQFGPGEDYECYPKDLDRDRELAEEVGVDIIFAPPPKEMYPQTSSTFVEVERLSEGICGRDRPGHFRGVATVVTKLFNITKPHRVYFGQKDYQQALIIKRMIEDLNFDMEFVLMPIIREEDGLAMSSRNTYLNQREREQALILYRSLKKAEELLDGGERRSEVILEEIREMISKEDIAQIDYIGLYHPETLAEIETVEQEALIALAVRIGKTRLIDNLLWRKKSG